MKLISVKRSFLFLIALLSPVLLFGPRLNFPIQFATPEDEKTIWVHLCDSEAAMTIENFTYELKKRIPDLELFVSTVTAGGKRAAEDNLDADDVRIIPNSDIQTMAYYFNRINPKAIIIVQHEIPPALILIARLNDIPVYFLGLEYCHGVERLLNTAPHLYIPLLNISDHIFARTKTDKAIFQNVGVTATNISSTGPLQAYGIINKKDAYLRRNRISEEEIKESFPHPIFLACCSNPKSLEHYLTLFIKVKESYPQAKLILAPEYFHTGKKELIPIAPKHFLSTKHSLISTLKQTGLSFYVWDEDSHTLNEEGNQFEGMRPLIEANDMILKSVPENFFFLQAFCDFFLIDETASSPQTHNLLHAGVFKKPTIIGPSHLRENLETSISSLQQGSTITDVAMYESVVTVRDANELYDNVMGLIENEELQKTIGQKLFEWTQNYSNQLEMELEPLLLRLEQDVLKYTYQFALL